MNAAKKPVWVSVLLGALALFAVSGVIVAIAQCLMIVIWPGEAVFTGPFFCASPYDEAIVVSDTESYPGGTTGSFTLMCVGARGQARDAGFLGPWLLLWACHTALVFIVLSLVLARRRSSGRAEGRVT